MPATKDQASIINKHCPDLAPLEDIHQIPEPAGLRVRSAKAAASHLERLDGFLVHGGVGGHGAAGMWKMVPALHFKYSARDMDALPQIEKTNLGYASTKIAKDRQGNQSPVTHACGHDMHTTGFMAAATLLHAASTSWKGTLMCLFQPDEETAEGAQAMADDGLYDTKRYGVPIPDVVLAQHDTALKTGLVALSGPILTAVDCFEVRILGKSGHVSRADLCIDPIVTASHIIVRLQTVVTKEVSPKDFAIVVDSRNKKDFTIWHLG